MEQFGDESWELDALEPPAIVELIRSEIEDLIDQDAWEVKAFDQDTGRKQLTLVANRWDDTVTFLLDGNGNGHD
jgi:hypothetical protein